MSISDLPTGHKIHALVTRFPRLFKGRQPRLWSSFPQGWAELTYRLFADLESMLEDEAVKHFEVIQIKEKFAGLRVYWQLDQEKILTIDIHGPGSLRRIEQAPGKPTALFDRIKERVGQACEEAATTCQRCGNGSATTNHSGYLVTLCPSCRAQLDLEAQQR